MSVSFYQLRDSLQVDFQSGLNVILVRDIIRSMLIATHSLPPSSLSPDPLHSYLGLCGLSLMNYSQLKPINASLNISQRAAEWLQAIHDRHQPIGI